MRQVSQKTVSQDLFTEASLNLSGCCFVSVQVVKEPGSLANAVDGARYEVELSSFSSHTLPFVCDSIDRMFLLKVLGLPPFWF